MSSARKELSSAEPNRCVTEQISDSAATLRRSYKPLWSYVKPISGSVETPESSFPIQISSVKQFLSFAKHVPNTLKQNRNSMETFWSTAKSVGTPQNHFEAPQRQLWASRGHNWPLRIDFGYPWCRFGAPRNKNTTPLTHFAAPRNHNETPRSHLRVLHGYNRDSLSNLELRGVNSECRGTKSELQGDALELRKTTSELRGTSLY